MRHPQKSAEALVQARIIEYLVRAGCLVLRVNSGRKGQVAFVRWQVLGSEPMTTGVSDVLAITPFGRFLAVECKAPGEKATQAQLDFLDEARRRGAIAILASSVDDVIRQTGRED